MKRSEYDRMVGQGINIPAVDPSSTRWVKVGLGVFVGLVLIGIVGIVVLQLLARQVASAPTMSCLSRLRSIHDAARSWAGEHRTNQLPTGFALFSTQLNDPKLLHCPWDHTHTDLSAWSELTSSNTSYIIMPGGAVVDGTSAYVVCTFHHFAVMGNGELSHDRRGKPRHISP